LANKSFAFLADTINGVIQENPVTVLMKCNQVTPIGMATVREFDIEYCIVATDVYLVLYNSDVYGTRQFSTFDEFQVYMGGKCKNCAVICRFVIDCCPVTIDGCDVIIQASQCQCQFFIAGCAAQINGQNLIFFSNN
jgi:hypothetical protein